VPGQEPQDLPACNLGETGENQQGECYPKTKREESTQSLKKTSCSCCKSEIILEELWRGGGMGIRKYLPRFEMWLMGGGAKRPGEEIMRLFLRGNAEKGAKKNLK